MFQRKLRNFLQSEEEEEESSESENSDQESDEEKKEKKKKKEREKKEKSTNDKKGGLREKRITPILQKELLKYLVYNAQNDPALVVRIYCAFSGCALQHFSVFLWICCLTHFPVPQDAVDS